MIDVGPLHFLRGAWLLALLVLPLAWRLWRRRGGADGAWRQAIDPHLLPHLLGPRDARRSRWLPCIAALAYVLAVLALAGPAWRQVAQPLWQSRLPTVVAVDLSSAANATDLPPTRMAQMRARLSALLAHAPGPVGLVAFADDAFTVAPITDDAANVALFVDALEPSVMPVDGQSPARAIEWSRRLIERAGYPRGRIVLITDHADAAARRAARDARDAGHIVSALGVGTPAGASVPTAAGGAVRVALDEASLRALADAGGGVYARLVLDGGDRAVFDARETGAATRGRGEGRAWLDEGVVLVPVLMLLALILLARAPRAAGALLLVLCVRPAVAADLWLRDDQRAHRAIERGIEAYRRGDYARAAQDFAQADSAVAHYDRGNALAKDGRLEDALRAYDEALRRDPRMDDARANRDAVRRVLKRQAGDGARQGPSNAARSGAQGRATACAPGQAGCRDAARPQQARGVPSSSPSSPSSPSRAASTPASPADARRQTQADAAQRARMQRALGRTTSAPAKTQAPTPAQRERAMSNDAALRRVPDEPGNLLRAKFRLEYERRQRGGAP